MGWVTAEDYLQSEPTPGRGRAGDSGAHNKDHADSLLLLAKVFAGIEAEQATMTSVDRLGFHLRLKSADRVRGARIAFLVQARSVAILGR